MLHTLRGRKRIPNGDVLTPPAVTGDWHRQLKIMLDRGKEL